MNTNPQSYTGVAFNPVPNSKNKIHSDEIAKRFGFKGGLVPGVTLSAYLVQPALCAWGETWLNNGYAHIKVNSPVYDGNNFTVNVSPKNHGYHGELTSVGETCHAEGEVLVPDTLPDLPSYQNFGFLDEEVEAPLATRVSMEQLQQTGCLATEFLWSADHEMISYFRDSNAMPDLIRVGDGHAYANLSFLLGCANRHFARVASMSPWVHLETKSQQFKKVEFDTALISEMTILDLFNKKGHEFADCQFNLYEKNSHQCVISVWQRAIYSLALK